VVASSARLARAYVVVSAQGVGEVAPRRRAGGRDVLVADRLVDRHMLSLNPAQITDAFNVAVARCIHDLTGNDEVAQELEELREVAIMDAPDGTQSRRPQRCPRPRFRPRRTAGRPRSA
jgi:hypothetical protein